MGKDAKKDIKDAWIKVKGSGKGDKIQAKVLPKSQLANTPLFAHPPLYAHDTPGGSIALILSLWSLSLSGAS